MGNHGRERDAAKVLCFQHARTGFSLPIVSAGKSRNGGGKGSSILDLTESNPTRCGFEAGEEILQAFDDARSLVYEPDPRGLLRAREAVCGYYAARGIRVRPEQMFLTTSTSEAYSYVFRLLADAGDKVLHSAAQLSAF